MKIEIDKSDLRSIVIMAARYANGRPSGASSIVRDVVRNIEKQYPNEIDWEDTVIQPPTEEELSMGFALRSDWLDDVFNKKGKKEWEI